MYIHNRDFLTKTPFIDSHVHLFDADASLKSRSKCCVGFADIDYNHPDKYKDMAGIYAKNQPIIDAPGMIPLVTAMDIDNIKKIWNSNPGTYYIDHKDGFKGFGELKLYDLFHGEPVKYCSLRFLREVLKFSRSVGCRPVYIHYILRDAKKVSSLISILKDYADVPIVLCHCGIDDAVESMDWCWMQACQLATTFTNLFLDVSWDALYYLYRNPMKIYQAPAGQLIIGSDKSPLGERSKHPTHTQDEIEFLMMRLGKYIDFDRNIRNLFNYPQRIVYI